MTGSGLPEGDTPYRGEGDGATDRLTVAYTHLWTSILDMNTPQKLVTKEMAAELLTVSMRTINNWISDGTLPMPTAIGRRVYWHPNEFREWQDSLFGRAEKFQGPAMQPPVKRSRGRPRNQMH